MISHSATRTITSQTRTKPRAHPSKRTAIPTLFMHGFGGNASGTSNLIDSAQAAGYATRTLLVTVSAHGKLSWHGSWPPKPSIRKFKLFFRLTGIVTTPKMPVG
ncbi:alpha/beta hydrolase [Levilactobacillus brevis]|nr:alpha/beta hydrolase [Levilactobacillus brevis]